MDFSACLQHWQYQAPFESPATGLLQQIYHVQQDPNAGKCSPPIRSTPPSPPPSIFEFNSL